MKPINKPPTLEFLEYQREYRRQYYRRYYRLHRDKLKAKSLEYYYRNHDENKAKNLESVKRRRDNMSRILVGITEGIVLHRREDTGEAQTNIYHRVTHHSPDGFEWGYGGSGPADLALNVLENALIEMGYQGEKIKCWKGKCFKLAWNLHQAFKRDFIAGVPPEGMVIPWGDVQAWILERMEKGER